MNHYLVSLCWSAKDDAFIAELPELPGCMADGATKQAALKKAEQVIKEWIATAKSLGRPIPEPKGRLAYA
jgi:predicted RNase H-like HicB family nuclease